MAGLGDALNVSRLHTRTHMYVLLVVALSLVQDLRRTGVVELHGHRGLWDADGEAQPVLQPVRQVGVVHGRGEQRPPAAVGVCVWYGGMG